MQPSEIENMFYYEYWYYVKNLSEYIKEKNKQQQAQQEQQEERSSSMRNQYKPKAPKMPKMPSIKTPSFKMPKM
tara:strand:+ start:2868 stop:3089 length:222 start_codon:yes stop_codon:yes gene_type:complete